MDTSEDGEDGEDGLLTLSVAATEAESARVASAIRASWAMRASWADAAAHAAAACCLAIAVLRGLYVSRAMAASNSPARRRLSNTGEHGMAREAVVDVKDALGEEEFRSAAVSNLSSSHRAFETALAAEDVTDAWDTTDDTEFVDASSTGEESEDSEDDTNPGARSPTVATAVSPWLLSHGSTFRSNLLFCCMNLPPSAGGMQGAAGSRSLPAMSPKALLFFIPWSCDDSGGGGSASCSVRPWLLRAAGSSMERLRFGGFCREFLSLCCW